MNFLKETKVAAIIVTFNRRELLKECVESVLRQTFPVTAVLIVDNASTDGTEEFLKGTGILDRTGVQYLRLPRNEGGAGGFHAGMRAALKNSYDWLWLMDDDVLCTPNALETLIRKTGVVGEQTGFLCSKVLWKNGEAHRMNVPIVQGVIGGIAFHNFDQEQVLLIRSGSFVSTLIRAGAARDVGLPIKEFFIWRDDVEYTERLTQAGHLGLYVKDSLVYHQTAENYSADIYTDIYRANPKEAWKYFFCTRNLLYSVRKASLASYGAHILYHLTLFNYRIFFRRNNARAVFIRTNTLATLASLFFFPVIEKVERPAK